MKFMIDSLRSAKLTQYLAAVACDACFGHLSFVTGPLSFVIRDTFCIGVAPKLRRCKTPSSVLATVCEFRTFESIMVSRSKSAKVGGRRRKNRVFLDDFAFSARTSNRLLHYLTQFTRKSRIEIGAKSLRRRWLEF
jgi:hypothetical protein